MAKHSFWSRVKQGFLKSARHRTQGFTLLELLVVTAIAGGIVAGLSFIVVQMMTADQRESSRSETQREMQQALDYISAELQEAVYVYPGEYLECSGKPNGNCENFSKFLPTSVSKNSVPVLAFWKMQPFPQQVKNRCAGGPQDDIACLAGQSYALVVYSLRKNDGTEPAWKGKARLTRYVLSQFDANGNSNTGYVNPGLYNNLTSWPYGTDSKTTGLKNLQAAAPTGEAFTLVDFVSFDYADPGLSNDLGQTGFCPDLPTEAGATDAKEYSLSPTNNMLTGQFAGVRSFYACVLAPTQTVKRDGKDVIEADATQYRDVIVYLRGSASGRPGILSDKNGLILTSRDADILPTLQTRVLSRSVLGRQPTNSSN